MRHVRARNVGTLSALTLTAAHLTGCAESTPEPIHPLSPPSAVLFGELRLFEHPLAHVYARSTTEARDAIRWMVVQRRKFMLWFPDVAPRQLTVYVNPPSVYAMFDPSDSSTATDAESSTFASFCSLGHVVIADEQGLGDLARRVTDDTRHRDEHRGEGFFSRALGQALVGFLVQAVTEDLQRMRLWIAWLADHPFPGSPPLPESADAAAVARGLLVMHVFGARDVPDELAPAFAMEMRPPNDGPWMPVCGSSLSQDQAAKAARWAWDEFRRRRAALLDEPPPPDLTPASDHETVARY